MSKDMRLASGLFVGFIVICMILYWLVVGV